MINNFLLVSVEAVEINFSQPAVEVLQSGFKNSESSVSHVFITLIICVAVVLVALIALFALRMWKSEEQKSKNEEREFNLQREREECIRKQRAELIVRYLDFLKNQPDDNTSDSYRTSMEYFIQLYHNDDAKFSADELKTMLEKMNKD